jgi:cytochrome c553
MRLLRHVFIVMAALAATAPAALAQTFDERLQLCMACHGEKGQSETENVPSLGGQPSMYGLIQLYMFRQNLRTAEPMNDMAKGLTDAELQRFADIIAKLPPPKPVDGMDADRAGRAQALVAAHRCAFCHNSFAGSEAVPRIAAQREDYLLKSLREYKSGARREYQPVMAEVMTRLTDADIVDLSHFLARTEAR